MAAKRAKPAKIPTHTFRTRILPLGGLYGIVVPAAVSRAIGVRGNVSVLVRANGCAPYHGTLMPRGGGRHCMLLNQEVRGGARAGNIDVEIRVVKREREVAIPEDLEAALRDEGVLAAWEALPPGKREHILKYIDGAVHETTRAKRIGQAVEVALARHEQNLDRAGASR